MNPYKIDREGKDCNSDGELSCLCLAFSSPLLPPLLIAKFLMQTAFAALPLL